MSAEYAQRREQEESARNTMHQAKGGHPAVLRDLVDFARVAPYWCFADVANTLADLLTANGASSSQKVARESLRGAPIYSHIEREAAINRLTSRARISDPQTLYDLVEMAARVTDSVACKYLSFPNLATNWEDSAQ